MADETRLRQVLLNLLSNAVKFSPARRPGRLRAWCHGQADSDGRIPVRFEVRDEGPGVPQDQRTAIFGDFVQVERTGTPDGAGLGLAIAAYMVDRMDGRIGCDDNTASRTGHGALFWVELPLPPARPAALPVAVAAPEATGTARPMRILVADDVAGEPDGRARAAGIRGPCGRHGGRRRPGAGGPGGGRRGDRPRLRRRADGRA